MSDAASESCVRIPVWQQFERGYDRNPELTARELAAIDALRPSAPRRSWLARPETHELARLVGPLLDALRSLDLSEHTGANRPHLAARALLCSCWHRRSSFWAWNDQIWVAELSTMTAGGQHIYGGERRQLVAAIAYLLGCFRSPWLLRHFNRHQLARKVFGGAAVDSGTTVVSEMLRGWGYQRTVRFADSPAQSALIDAFLVNGTANLNDITLGTLKRIRTTRDLRGCTDGGAHALHRVLHALDILPPPPPQSWGWRVTGPDPRWVAAVERWNQTSTLTRSTRRSGRTILFKAGRWLATVHPDIHDPAQWTREICTEWVAAVDRMAVGDFNSRPQPGTGKPISPSCKAVYIGALRGFFRDCQEWGWIERTFDPGRAFMTPRTVRNSVGPNPRVIEESAWAKLLWAGLNLTRDDLPERGGRYPLVLWRALALAWLFSGSRSNEIVRLRVGCVRWQKTDDADAVCLLDVPVTKTSTAFTRPVDPILGRALEEWQAVRPSQPKLVDWRTGERVDMLFALRGQPVGRHYINIRLIPALCRKAGVPRADVRGTITSHRARATIASQLYNAKEPFTLAELQQWLGHRSPIATQYYAAITPTALSRAYRDAGYFSRNLRTIEVLIDRAAVESGAAAAGEPWRYYDLGHGFCTYTFFEQCPHRMACARCDFYRPKSATAALVAEGRANLERMLKEVPLTDDERAAVDEGIEALSELVNRLTDVPTPAGPTPRELGAQLRRLPMAGTE